MSNIVIIPARGGSKSLPRKNVRQLCGHPLIAYSIATGKAILGVSEVLVSTDDSEIAKVAETYGARVIWRPSILAGDLSRDDGLILHALEVANFDLKSTNIIFLRPTHPVRNTHVVNSALDTFLGNENVDSLRSMKLSKEVIFKSWIIGSDGYAVSAFNPSITEVLDPPNAPRQSLPASFYQDGYVDIFSARTVLDFKNTSGRIVKPFFIEDFSQDIDTLEDFSVIEEFLSRNPMPNWMANPQTCQQNF